MQINIHALVVPAVGTSIAIMTVVLLALWKRRCDQQARDLDSLEPRIVVTGTRGKSSTVRLLHGALRQAGLRPYGRVTGTVTEELDPNGERVVIRRTGAPTILEMIGTVQRAKASHASTLVTECMAVVPSLISLVQTRFVRGDIAVITNARADHLEEEGLDLLTTARTLGGVGVGAMEVITAEHDPQVRAAMLAPSADTVHHATDASQLQPDPAVLAQLPLEHPDNVATVLAVTRRMSIPDEVAVEGMTHATHEPHDVELRTLTRDGVHFSFINLGTINDPESVRAPLQAALVGAPRNATRVAVLVNRWDRPYRAIEFAASLSPDVFDGVLMTGSTSFPTWLALRRSGWSSKRIRRLRWIDLRSREAFLKRISSFGARSHRVVSVALENIDNTFAQRMLKLVGTVDAPPQSAPAAEHDRELTSTNNPDTEPV